MLTRRTGIPKTGRQDGHLIRAGFSYIAHDPKLAAVVSLKAGVSILGASWVLLSGDGRARLPSSDRGYFARARGACSE